MENEIIRAANLSKRFEKHLAVDGLSFHVNRSDVYGFLGPNGAGKSTTIRMLLSLIKPTSGKIEVLGKQTGSNRDYLRHIGCIIEKPDFYLYLSAKKNLELLGAMFSDSISKNRIMEMIELVGLKGRENDRVKTYSHGMKQRLGIAQALLHDPELIILDEPTTGLDPQGIIDIRNLILHLKNQKNKTIFLSSHILHEIELIANRMIIINQGKKIVEGDVDELLGHHSLIIEIEIEEVTVALNKFSETQFEKQIISHDGKHIRIKGNRELIPQLTEWLNQNNLRFYSITYQRTLEEMFLNLTHNHAASDKN